MNASKTETKTLTTVPLIGQVGSYVSMAGHDEDMPPERRADRHHWTNAADPETITRVVALLQSVYDRHKAAHDAWSARMLKARDGHSGEEYAAACCEWRDIAQAIRADLAECGWDVRHSRIAQDALGGDVSSDRDLNVTTGGGILAADEPGRDSGYRGTIMTAIWRFDH